MKPIKTPRSRTLPALALALGLVSTSVAEQEGSRFGVTQKEAEQTRMQDGPHWDSTFENWNEPERSFHSTNLIGAKVKTQRGDKEIGEVSNLIFDENGQIAAAVIEVAGEREVAIPWEATRPLEQHGDEWVFRLDIDEATLERAPDYVRD